MFLNSVLREDKGLLSFEPPKPQSMNMPSNDNWSCLISSCWCLFIWSSRGEVRLVNRRMLFTVHCCIAWFLGIEVKLTSLLLSFVCVELPITALHDWTRTSAIVAVFLVILLLFLIFSGVVDLKAVVEGVGWVEVACVVGGAWWKGLAHLDMGGVDRKMDPWMDLHPWGTDVWNIYMVLSVSLIILFLNVV